MEFRQIMYQQINSTDKKAIIFVFFKFWIYFQNYK